MKPFEKQTYYEILEIPPDAKTSDIRDAYRTALEIYGDDSLASYSFFNEDERKSILARLESAFTTLINRKQRLQYDRDLVADGVIEKALPGEKVHMESVPTPVSHPAQAERQSSPTQTRAQLTAISLSMVTDPLFEKEVVTGADLQKMRTTLGITLEQISKYTKIRTVFLCCIEEDRFEQLPSMFHLKSFLKAYLQCFTKNADPLVGKYMARVGDKVTST